MKKYVAEFIGTFFLVLIVVLVSNNGTGALAPIAMGAILTVMAFASGHVSGGYFNPAVTLAVLMRGKLSRFDFPNYVVAQLLGAVLGALIGAFLLSTGGGPTPEARSHDLLPAMLAEFFGTFALAYVVLNVTTLRANESNAHYGLAIGFTVIGISYAFSGISGGAFNPAIALGISIGHMTAWNDLWIYLAGDLLGAAAAATVFQAVHGLQD